MISSIDVYVLTTEPVLEYDQPNALLYVFESSIYE